MCTTLNLLLGDRHAHELPRQYITREQMLTLHMALLKWLILGTPPTWWQIGCIHRNISLPTQAHTCPYFVLSIVATASLPKGQPWRPVRTTSFGPLPTITPTPLETGEGTLTPQGPTLPFPQPPYIQATRTFILPSAHDLALTTDPTSLTPPPGGGPIRTT